MFSWQKLPKPFFALAPMEDVTDTVFRRIISSLGAPSVYFTEFTNCEALLSKGRSRVDHRIFFTENEHPLIAQIWGTKPEQYYEVAKMLLDMGFDGIDINMGCPERSVLKIGACSALINNPTLAKEIIDATKKGADGKIPVSVKTRLGYKEFQTEEWLGFLLDQGISALTVHGRTVAELSQVPAHWDEIGKAVVLRDQKMLDTVIIGNGDITSYQDGIEKAEKYSIDGIMVGRGIFHNPWLFNKSIDPTLKSQKERLSLLLKHVELFDATWGGRKNYQILKKYFKIYIQGFDNASGIRAQLMETKNAAEAKEIVTRILNI